MNNSFRKRISIAASLGLLGLFLVLTPAHDAHASVWGNIIGGMAAGTIGMAATSVLYLVSVVAGALISLFTYFASVILDMSNNLVNAYVVQTGFQITLAVTNLGFVLAIIIIALATILHRENYGIKKTLWRLIVAAILVNFSLVIGGAIINFSNVITDTFMGQVTPGPGLSGAAAFSQDLTASFEPQDAYLSYGNNQLSQAQAQSDLAQGIADWINPVVGLIGGLAVSLIDVVTMAVFLVMLLVRYVTLGILLILMPFVWLFWLFPQTKKHWDKWWEQFIRWTFFAPIVVFFLWLATAMMEGSSSRNPVTIATQDQMYSANSPLVHGFMTGLLSNIAVPALQAILFAGLALGGIIAADKMSITGASVGLGAVKSAGGAFGNYVGKQGKKASRAVAQRTIAHPAVTGRLQRVHAIPGVSALGRAVEATTAKGGKDFVSQAEKDLNVKNMSKQQWENAMAGARGNENTLALIKQGASSGWLANYKGKVAGAESLVDWTDLHQQVYKDYDHGKLAKDVDTVFLSTSKARELERLKTGVVRNVTAKDEHGIMGEAGSEVNANELKAAALKAGQNAREALRTGGPDATLKISGKDVSARTLSEQAAAARESANAAINAVGSMTSVNNYKGKEVKIKDGDDNQTTLDGAIKEQHEKFVNDRNADDIRKAGAGAAFGGGDRPIVGLDKETVESINNGFLKAALTKKPGLINPLVSKVENWDTIRNIVQQSHDVLEELRTGGKVTGEDYKMINEQVTKGLKGALVRGYAPGPQAESGGSQESSPAQESAQSAPAPAPPQGGQPQA